MGLFRSSKHFNTFFDGDVISCRFEPICRFDMLRLLRAHASGRPADVLALVAEIVPKYARNFKGPVAADGTAVTLREVFAVKYFEKLAARLADALVRTVRNDGSSFKPISREEAFAQLQPEQ